APRRADDDLLLLARHHDAPPRKHFQAAHGRVARFRLRRAVGQPLLDAIVSETALRDALPAAVLHNQGRLLQENTSLWVGYDTAPALGALHNLGVIEQRVEAEQAQLEAAPAVLRAVAGALVAAELGQDRLHFAGERNR